MKNTLLFSKKARVGGSEHTQKSIFGINFAVVFDWNVSNTNRSGLSPVHSRALSKKSGESDVSGSSHQRMDQSTLTLQCATRSRRECLPSLRIGCCKCRRLAWLGRTQTQRTLPVGQKRHLDVAGQKLPQDDFRLAAIPEGPARHLDASRQKLTPHCLAPIFDSQLPSPKLSLKMPPKLPLPHNRGHFFLFQNCPRGEGICAAIERQKLSRGNFCLAASRCLFWPTVIVSQLPSPWGQF